MKIRYLLAFLIACVISFIFLFLFRVELIESHFSKKGTNEVVIRKNSLLVSKYPITYFKRRIEKEINYYFNYDDKYELKNAVSLRKNIASSKHIVEVNQEHFLPAIHRFDLNNDEEQYFKRSLKSQQQKFSAPTLQWILELGSKGTIEARPTMCNSLLISTTNTEVIAIDFRSGEVVWRIKFPNSLDLAKRSVVCAKISIGSRFIIFVPSANGIYCLNASNGKIATDLGNQGRIGHYLARIPPQIHENIIFVATMNPSGLEAYDLISGNRLWRTEFEKGESLLRGGSNPWSGMTIDRHRGLIYVNTGSPSHWHKYVYGPDKYRYSNSLLAVRIENGSIKWQFSSQSVDFWDHDLVGEPILIDKIGGTRDAVVTLSKGGSIYFIDRDTGQSLYPLDEQKYSFGNLSYTIKSMTTANPLIDLPDKIRKCTTCGPTTLHYGMIPPIMKMERIFDGVSGGPQWPGASYDKQSRLLLVPSNRNVLYHQFYDFEVKTSNSFLSSKKSLSQCFGCHNEHGKVEFRADHYVPSLLFVSKLYDEKGLLKFLNTSAHSSISIDPKMASELFDLLKQYDALNFQAGNFKVFNANKYLNPLSGSNRKLAPFGLITAISVDTGKLVWQRPSGQLTNNVGITLLGSPNFGGVAVEPANTLYSYFTGSYDKNIYALSNLTGETVWDYRLNASGSAPPLVLSEKNEQWLFVIATGGRIAGDNGSTLYSFMRSTHSDNH